DSIQFRLDYGPSVTSSRTGTVVRAHASEAHSRWPQFASAAKAVGAVSFLSMPLPGRERPLGTLNLYSHDLRGFTGADVALLQLFAVTSAYALHSSQRLDIARKHAMDLERALESRGVIEQAKGIIMGTHHVDADRAFRILIQDSQRSNVKLRVIAQQYIDGAIDPRQATNKPETN
ncbi:ANTAR domain-containing response regulator, partial [Rhodococcus sp. no. 34]